MTKIVLITGATSGIGKACARTFASEGYQLILAARREERLQKLSDELIREHSSKITTLQLDVRFKDQVEEKLSSLPEDWRKIDVFINNAGLSLGLDPLQDGIIEDWDVMIDTNVKGFLYVSRIVTSWMIKQNQGHVINICSIAGKEVYPNGNVYCATKHAVDALSKAMRIDLLPYGIRVTAVHPGAVETEFSEVRFKGDKERAKKVYEGFVPLHAEDIAEAIWYAASRKTHVNVNELTIMPTAQASAAIIFRSKNAAS
jgi:NADP-dependent 3-hydroxy acid dehydrogenase YdfG